MKIAARTTGTGCFYRYWTPLAHLERAGHAVYAESQQLQVYDHDDDVRQWTLVGRTMRTAARGRLADPSAHPETGSPDVVFWYGVGHQLDVIDWRRLAESRPRPRLVYGLVDDFVSADHVERDVVYSGPVAWTRRMRARVLENHREMCRLADAVVVTSVGLADAVRPFNPHVYVVGNYLPQSWSERPPEPHQGPFTVGWTGGTSHAMDTREAGPPIGQWLRKNRTVHFYCRGYRPPELWAAAWPSHRSWETWMHPADSHFRTPYDVAVIPLIDHPVNRARTDIKFHEAALRGVPVIASDIGPYRRGVDHGRTGLLVRRPSDWASYLDLLRSRSEREQLARAARAEVLGRTIERHTVRWERALTPGHVAGPVDQEDPYGPPPVRLELAGAAAGV